MSRKSLHCKSLVLGYYPILPEMFWSSGFLIFRRKNRWKIIFDGSYGKLFSRSFSFYFSADFSIHSFLNNSWGNFVYKRNQGVECHGNHRTQLYQMHTRRAVLSKRAVMKVFFTSLRHDVECIVLRIGNKNGAPLVEVTCFLVEVTRFFLKSDLQMTEP